MSTRPEDNRIPAFASGQSNVVSLDNLSENSSAQSQVQNVLGSTDFTTPATPVSHRDSMRPIFSTSDSSPTSVLHPIAGPSRPSHYPTPQSPGNVSAYFPGYVPLPDSPLSLFPSRNTVEEPEQNANIQLDASWTPLGFVASNVTPNDTLSPQTRSKNTLSTHPVTPRPHSAPFGSTSSYSYRDKLYPSTPQHAHSMHIISPPMSPSSLSPENGRKGYTSSLMSSLSPLEERNHRLATPLLQPQPTTPVNNVTRQPVDILFSPARIIGRTTPIASSSSIFQRTLSPDERRLGGEMDRIRENLAATRSTHALDLETRKPDYMKRRKRPNRSDFSHGKNDGRSQDGVGIVMSPVKGRRIELFDFKHTSDESFEERLMTHGYGTYGEPRIPQRQTSRVDGLSQEAYDWLTFNTPGTAKASSVLGSPVPIANLSEKEQKKRKRLEAFTKSSSSESTSRLYPVEVAGKGRMLLNVPPEEFEEVYMTSPKKKRATGRKKKAAVPVETKSKAASKKVATPVLDRPKWLDQEFPWRVRKEERHAAETLEEKERLRCIERFLDRDTDSGEENEVEELVFLSDLNRNSLPPRQGRGKAVPLDAEPDNFNWSGSKETVFFPSDPADARIALLSKRVVRGLTRRRRVQGDANDENDDVTCLCGNTETDTDTHLVQCDDCHKWYHMRCVGIYEPEDLPREDETWYCPKCMDWPVEDLSDLMHSTPPARREPILVPTDDVPLSVTRDIAIYQSSPQGSPSRVWQHSTVTSPRTPKRNKNQYTDFSSRSTWDDSGAGPSTPFSSSHSVHVYGMPENRLAEDSSFDPTSTPTRGLNLGLPLATPKSGWMARTGDLFSTPRGGGFRNPFGDDSGFGNTYKSIYSYDDTPIRRASANSHRPLAPQPLLDSPLLPRPTGKAFSQLADSPIVKSRKNNKESEYLT